MASTDVKPAETSSRGVHVLKRYLEYAEGRGGAAGRGNRPRGRQRLRSRGRRSAGARADLRSIPSSGVSGFRIDLARPRIPIRPESSSPGSNATARPTIQQERPRPGPPARRGPSGLGWEIAPRMVDRLVRDPGSANGEAGAPTGRPCWPVRPPQPQDTRASAALTGRTLPCRPMRRMGSPGPRCLSPRICLCSAVSRKLKARGRSSCGLHLSSTRPRRVQLGRRRGLPTNLEPLWVSSGATGSRSTSRAQSPNGQSCGPL